MGRTKIRIGEFVDLVRADTPSKEIAKHFGVSLRAVQKKRAKLESQVTECSVRHHAKEIVRQELDAREQLLKINNSANRVLDLLEARLQQDQEAWAEQILGKLAGLKGELDGEGCKTLELIVEAIEGLIDIRPATLELLLKAQAEIRQQVALVAKVTAELLEAKKVNDAHRIMVEEIGRESPDCQNRIIQRLKGSQLLFAACGVA